MPLEPELEDAIIKVVAEKNQPDQVARRLIAWLEEMSKAELGRDDQMRHFDNMRSAISLPEDSDAH